MKILITSDLHADFKRARKLQFSGFEQDVDLVIIAGDVANDSGSTIKFINELEFEKLWIAGNHDYWQEPLIGNLGMFKGPGSADPYHSPPPRPNIEIAQKLYSSKTSGFMNRTIHEINGERILGCTLWYPLSGWQEWSDHETIPDWRNIEREATLDLLFLEENVQPGDIVVTHMLPSYQCVEGKYVGNPTTKFYVHSVDHIIMEKKPKLWISGHSHSRMIKHIGPEKETLYIRNPRGYNDENPNYSHLIVDTTRIKEYDAIYDCGYYATHGISIKP